MTAEPLTRCDALTLAIRAIREGSTALASKLAMGLGSDADLDEAERRAEAVVLLEQMQHEECSREGLAEGLGR